MSIPRSYFITPQTAEKAVRMTLPLIREAMKEQEVGESGFLYLVVMNPACPPTACSFEEAILYEHAVGDRSRWDADYAAFARAKTRVAWHAGIDSHLVQEMRPYRLIEGDTLLWGSIVLDGIVVGASGANPWYDEAFSGAVAMCLRAIAKGAAIRGRQTDLFLKAT